MTRDAARALLAGLLHRVCPDAGLDDVDPEGPIQDVLGIDSIDFLNLVAALADEAGIDVPERDFPALATIGGFVDYLADG